MNKVIKLQTDNQKSNKVIRFLNSAKLNIKSVFSKNSNKQNNSDSNSNIVIPKQVITPVTKNIEKSHKDTFLPVKNN